MLLQGRQGTELELHLVEYRFPDEERDPWDSNALLVSVRILNPDGSWEVVDPCLTTWEADQVVRWLALLALRNDVLDAQLSEPNVTLTGRANRAQRPGDLDRIDLRACFALELRPPWLGAGNLCVDLDVSGNDLTRAAVDLRRDLERLPQRGADPTR